MSNTGVHEDAIPRLASSQTKIQQAIDSIQTLQGEIQSLVDEGLISGEAAHALSTKFASDTKTQVENHQIMHQLLEEHKVFYTQQLDASRELARRTLS